MTKEVTEAQLGRLAGALRLRLPRGVRPAHSGGLDALLADVDSPSLPLLAGLARR